MPGSTGSELLYAIDDNGVMAVYDNKKLVDSYKTGLDDLEGITFGESNDMVYLGQEFPATVLEFDVVEKKLTGRTWLLDGFGGDSKHGLEGLAYYPSPKNTKSTINNTNAVSSTGSSAGYFLTANQATGSIIVYSVDVTPGVNDPCIKVHSYTIAGWKVDISGLNYDALTDSILAISDTYNELVSMKIDPKLFVTPYTTSEAVVNFRQKLPYDGQEGIASRINDEGESQIFVALDDGKDSDVKRFNMPIDDDCF
jgi:uncharacterized protein YjiK